MTPFEATITVSGLIETGQIYKLNTKLPNIKPAIHPICIPFMDFSQLPVQ